MRFDPEVHTNLSSAMQRLSDAAIHGYTQHVHGEIDIEKLPAFLSKMDGKYDVAIDRTTRSINRSKGIGCAKLILLQQGEKVLWWLLVIPATTSKEPHPAHHKENLADARSTRTPIRCNGYELVRLNLPHRSSDGRTEFAVRWTWRMSQEKYTSWRLSILEAIRKMKSDRFVNDLLHKLYSAPGFAGIRKQVGALAVLYRAEWSRHRGNQKIIRPPSRLGYVRRLPNQGFLASTLVAMHSK